jgi:predicted CoA-binding protein
MAQPNVSMAVIEKFFAQKSIAVVGMPRERSADTMLLFQLFEELCRRGHDIIPVNPNASDILGHRCFARVQDIQPVPDAALLLTSPAVTNSIVRDCAAAGIKLIWMYRGGGQGSVSEDAVDFCRTHGIDLVPGQCPFMFLLPVRSFHWFHRLVFKITGQYPRQLKSPAA